MESTTDKNHAVQIIKLMAKTNMPFDRFITKYRMPVVDGYKYASCPSVGMDDYTTKPVNGDVLMQKINGLVFQVIAGETMLK